MATSTSQRMGILIILIVTIVGTVGSFAVMILANKNQAEQSAKFQKIQEQYTAKQKEYQAKVDAQNAELSTKYYPVFSPYFDRIGAFDLNSVKELSTEDLMVGDGEELTGTTSFVTYFVGWDANGHRFEGGINVDFDNHTLTTPFPVEGGLDSASLIQGWKEGMKGMHMNGVRLITIPSDKAYGAAGSKDNSGKETIAPNMPLKFLVMPVPAPTAIPQPDTTELMKAYSELNQ